MHKSVGVIIRNQKDEILMIDRSNIPYGWACPAGHIDEGETPENAMLREAKEETGLDILSYKILAEEYIEWNECRTAQGHHWYLYEVLSWKGEVIIEEEEAKDWAWKDASKINPDDLEPVWKYWFDKFNIK
ncbi:hypothetical protein C0584_00320 [Candidatus Parcubacteria bacterium]|nr:MAG: hypothetical protein C0584_00320 [Candidatus Parcubacteria bacterium]